MPKATEAAQAWLEDLKKTGAISEEELKVLEAATSKPQVAEYIGGSQLRQQDYSKRLNEAQTAYDTKSQEILAYERELANWRANTEKSVTQLQQELHTARAERERILRTAQTYGLSEDDFGASVANFSTPVGVNQPAVNPEPDKPQFDPTKFVSKEEAEQLGQMYTLLPAEISDIISEHVELFGKQPKGMRQIVERAIKERRALRDVYAEEFKVADRRKELDDAAREAEIKRRVEEELIRYRSENPNARIPLPGRQPSPVLQEFKGTAAENPANAKNEAVSAAVAYWNQMQHSEE